MSLRRKCPFCLERLGSIGSRENVSISMDTKRYRCWRCGKSGLLTKRVALLLGVPVEEALTQSDIEKILSDELPQTESLEPDGFVPLYPWKDTRGSFVLKKYLDYLRRRGVTPSLVENFRVGVILEPKEKRFLLGSLAFPILDGANKGYVFKNPKLSGYRHSTGLPRFQAIFNGRLLEKKYSSTEIYVVEGVFDCLALGGRAVATLGTSITRHQVERLAAAANPMVIAQDGDAWRVSRALQRQLALRGKKAYWLRLPPGHDPGDMGLQRVRKLPKYT